MEKPTRNSVDALAEKGLTVKQIAKLYGCSVNKIATMKSRKMQGWREDGVLRNPIWPDEIGRARRVPVGTKIRVCNHRKERKGNRPENVPAWGALEESRIVRKFPHVVLLENGMSVDYAEIAMQMREKQQAEGGKGCL